MIKMVRLQKRKGKLVVEKDKTTITIPVRVDKKGQLFWDFPKDKKKGD